MLQSIAEIISLLVLEYVIKGPGYAICRLFVRKQDLSSDQLKVALAGFGFWVAVIAACYAVYPYVMAHDA
jgi:hypothetical protein